MNRPPIPDLLAEAAVGLVVATILVIALAAAYVDVEFVYQGF